VLGLFIGLVIRPRSPGIAALLESGDRLLLEGGDALLLE
jgi:hypothetical protein